jgi:hypothetical protein
MRVQFVLVWGVVLLFAIALFSVLIATEGAAIVSDPVALGLVAATAGAPGLLFTGLLIWRARRHGAPLTRQNRDPRILEDTAVYDALGFLVAGRMRTGALLFHDQDYRRTEVEPARVRRLDWIEGVGSDDPPLRLIVDCDGQPPIQRPFGVFEDVGRLKAELATKLGLG